MLVILTSDRRSNEDNGRLHYESDATLLHHPAAAPVWSVDAGFGLQELTPQ